jgi:hypothetical protein
VHEATGRVVIAMGTEQVLSMVWYVSDNSTRRGVGRQMEINDARSKLKSEDTKINL